MIDITRDKKTRMSAAWRILQYQVVVALLITMVLFYIEGITAGVSAISGGAVAILPNIVLFKFMFHHQGARSAPLIVKNFYRGEVFKIILSAILFAFVFAFLKIIPMIFFIAFIITQMSFWLAPILKRAL